MRTYVPRYLNDSFKVMGIIDIDVFFVGVFTFILSFILLPTLFALFLTIIIPFIYSKKLKKNRKSYLVFLIRFGYGGNKILRGRRFLPCNFSFP